MHYLVSRLTIKIGAKLNFNCCVRAIQLVFKVFSATII